MSERKNAANEMPIRNLTGKEPEDSLPLATASITDVEVEVREDISVAKVKAQRFIDAVAGGAAPGKAAESVGLSLKKIKNSKEMSAAVKEVVETAGVSAEIRAMAVRAGLFQMFMESLQSPDLEERKHAATVAKLIAADPEIALGGEGTKVEISLNTLTDAAKSISINDVIVDLEAEKE